MEPFIREILAFEILQDFVNRKDAPFKELILDYYDELGGKLGFESRRDFPIERRKLNYGNIECVWLDSSNPAVAFELCFGSREEAMVSLWKLAELEPGYAVIITSGKAKNFSLDDLERMFRRSHLSKAKETAFLLVEINSEEFRIVH